METTTEQKYELSRTFQEEQKLRIFFMSIQQIGTGLNVRNIGVIAYRHSEAMKKGIEMYVTGNNTIVLISREEDSDLVENILRNVKMEGVTIVQPPMPQPAIEPKLTKEQFVARLLLATEEMVEEEADKKTIKKILEKIK